MKCDVPLKKQKKGSPDCGPVCVQMVLAHHGIKRSFSEISADIKISQTGTSSFALGSYLIAQGFSVEIITHNQFICTRADREKSQKALLQQFKRIREKVTKKRKKEIFGDLIHFMESGGSVCIDIPDASHIRKSLQKKQLMIALLTSNFLTQKKVGYNFHFNVVTGVEKGSVCVNDPVSGKKQYPMDDFLFGLHASCFGDPDNGSLLRVSKRDIT